MAQLSQGLEELGVDGGKVAGMNAGGADGSEEVGVIRPAGDDMDVKMFGHTGAAGGAEVEPDIKTRGLQAFLQGGGHAVDEGPQIG